MGHINIVNIRLSNLNKRYLVNNRSMEIHDLYNTKHQCFIDEIVDKTYISEWQLKDYLSDGYNGCRWCNYRYDTDMR